jgi:hypothetical protein
VADKLSWSGVVVGVQPRILLTRSFDQRQRSYLGYVLRVEGSLGPDVGVFTVGIGKAAQAKHQLRAGDRVQGMAQRPDKPAREPADGYRVSGLKIVERAGPALRPGPPFLHLAPGIEVYRELGMRRLDARRYASACLACTWGCEMAVEMIIDPWNPQGPRRHRRETFCYGPKACPSYLAGPTRQVPGRKGMKYEEPDEVDENETSGRGPEA